MEIDYKPKNVQITEVSQQVSEKLVAALGKSTREALEESRQYTPRAFAYLSNARAR